MISGHVSYEEIPYGQPLTPPELLREQLRHAQARVLEMDVDEHYPALAPLLGESAETIARLTGALKGIKDAMDQTNSFEVCRRMIEALLKGEPLL